MKDISGHFDGPSDSFMLWKNAYTHFSSRIKVSHVNEDFHILISDNEVKWIVKTTISQPGKNTVNWIYFPWNKNHQTFSFSPVTFFCLVHVPWRI